MASKASVDVFAFSGTFVSAAACVVATSADVGVHDAAVDSSNKAVVVAVDSSHEAVVVDALTDSSDLVDDRVDDAAICDEVAGASKARTAVGSSPSAAVVSVTVVAGAAASGAAAAVSSAAVSDAAAACAAAV